MSHVVIAIKAIQLGYSSSLISLFITRSPPNPHHTIGFCLPSAPAFALSWIVCCLFSFPFLPTLGLCSVSSCSPVACRFTVINSVTFSSANNFSMTSGGSIHG